MYTLNKLILGFQNWTIHGIGVTTQNGDVKSYCNSSVEYDPKLIHPLIEQLTLAWTNDHANSPAKNKLWKFEWLKHGSCGLDIGAIDNEFKYFSKGKSPLTTFSNNLIFKSQHWNGMEDIHSLDIYNKVEFYQDLIIQSKMSPKLLTPD